jgi:uncharacterized membrane protein
VQLNDVIEDVGKAIDAIGVVTIVIGAVAATVMSLRQLRARTTGVYRIFRERLGRAILLGLELLVAADIIRTVAATPTLTSVAILAAIVAIRTFLSFSLEVEISGSWPWRRAAEPSARQVSRSESAPAARPDEPGPPPA